MTVFTDYNVAVIQDYIDLQLARCRGEWQSGLAGATAPPSAASRRDEGLAKTSFWRDYCSHRRSQTDADLRRHSTGVLGPINLTRVIYAGRLF